MDMDMYKLLDMKANIQWAQIFHKLLERWRNSLH